MTDPKQNLPKRDVALKVSIKDILNKETVPLANLMGTIISKEERDQFQTDLIIDDGSENILIRNFNRSSQLNDLLIGDSILVIGRSREFDGKRYISADTVKKNQFFMAEG